MGVGVGVVIAETSQVPVPIIQELTIVGMVSQQDTFSIMVQIGV